MWQALYQELEGKGFVVIAVALESRGAEAARPWIEAAKATYPCLVDATHIVAERYGMVNVPIGVWIDEAGTIVRPPEPAGTTDSFRAMDRQTFALSAEARADLRNARASYVAALRDWAERGAASKFALSPEEVRRRMAPPDEAKARATACFRMGEYLHAVGFEGDARAYFDEATRLHPQNWAFRRQAWNLEDPMKAGGKEFWAAVDALGDGHYYDPVEMPAVQP
ncbi:MAG: TlpA family protein disulfide reductase [Chloroflexi bacterium]|nr:TlpA family protein disulfide reductase [Chloroflexota bacterium]